MASETHEEKAVEDGGCDTNITKEGDEDGVCDTNITKEGDEDDDGEDELNDEVTDFIEGYDESDERLLPRPTRIGDVTRSHHVPKSERGQCQRCDTRFNASPLRRAHHCRRCGEVFCKECLQYRRRLDRLAQIDQQGVRCKVCFHCYEERPLTWGSLTRSRTNEFMSIRYNTRRTDQGDETLEQRDGPTVPLFWKEQFEVEVLRECQRLLSGFKSAVGSSEALRTINEVRVDLMKVPSWQKSDFWKLEKSQTTCRQCKERHKKHRRNCRVCGMALCKVCSVKELLVYYDDNDKPIKAHTVPRIVIIREEPAPEKEPSISLCLPVCSACKTEIVRFQQDNADWFKLKTRPLEGLALLQHKDQVLCDIQRVIEETQNDVTPQLIEYRSQLEQLDNLRSNRNFNGKRQTLLLNYTKAKKDFYWTVRRSNIDGESGQRDSQSSDPPSPREPE